MPLHLIVAKGPGLGEFSREPILTVACVLLILVSIGWFVVARLISRNLKRAAAATRRAAKPDPTD